MVGPAALLDVGRPTPSRRRAGTREGVSCDGVRVLTTRDGVRHVCHALQLRPASRGGSRDGAPLRLVVIRAGDSVGDRQRDRPILVRPHRTRARRPPRPRRDRRRSGYRGGAQDNGGDHAEPSQSALRENGNEPAIRSGPAFVRRGKPIRSVDRWGVDDRRARGLNQAGRQTRDGQKPRALGVKKRQPLIVCSQSVFGYVTSSRGKLVTKPLGFFLPAAHPPVRTSHARKPSGRKRALSVQARHFGWSGNACPRKKTACCTPA